MLYRPNLPPLPPQRSSPGALVTAGAIHVALLWLLLQYSPVQQAIRYVVYQYVQPISPNANAPSSRAITVRPPVSNRAAEMPPVFSHTPESSVPLKTTTQLPDTLKAKKPVTGPAALEPTPRVETPAEPEPAPVPEAPAPEPPVAAPAPVERAVVPPVEPPPPPAPPPPVPVPAPPIPAPVPAPAPVPVPAPATAPVPAPAPAPVPAPAPIPAPAPVAVEPAPVPAPPAPVAAPAPAPAPAAVAPPAPAPAMAPARVERLQGPVVDVPVPANSPAAVGAPTVRVAPAWPGMAPGGGTGPGGGAPGGIPGGAEPAPRPPAPLPAAPVISPIPPYLHPGPFRRDERSLSDRVNEQLRRDRKPAVVQEMENAGVDDCLHAPKNEQAVGGLLAAPGLAAKALAGKCPK